TGFRLVGNNGSRSNYPDGMSFDLNIKFHMSNFDGLTQKKGIGGAHNKEAFLDAVSTYGIKINEQVSIGVDGIYNVK
ncbi:hypothetical protein SB768_34165, partial [Burkholderia sp. SIMBA_043]